ncbi:MAG TPA: protein translocase subunit SecDF [Chitinophagaceae bacterium]
MQLKGLVRFFTVLLVLYSIYQLSFTWFVRSYENKLKASAERFIKAKYPEVRSKKVDQYPDSIKAAYDTRLTRLEDSTKDVTLTYGINGAISYQKAKENELNLGLDLQGGMNVALEVEMSGLLKSMANNSTDPIFLKAIANANIRKANSGADFVTLFYDEYQKLNPNGRLASLFANANQNEIKITDDNGTIITKIRRQARDAFDRTYKILRARIDQFGVAQPSINPDPEREIITVELPGVKNKERVRNYLQSTANLQFWLTYKPEEIVKAFDAANNEFDNYLKGIDTTTKADTSNHIDTANKTNPTIAKQPITSSNIKKRYLTEFIAPSRGGGIGVVKVKDTALVREYLESPQLRKYFPADARFAFGVSESKDKSANSLPLYILKTNGHDKAPIEGDVITDASQSYEQGTNSPNVNMQMSSVGARDWERVTETSYKETRPIAVVLDNIVYSAPIAYNGKISGGNTEINGNFTNEEAQDLANILKIGKLPAPAKIVQEQQVGPTLGAEAIRGGMLAFVVAFVIIFSLMLIYYNSSGWVTNIALILNLLFTIGILAGLGATLTAPGIAGLILTIGLAVDTNVITKERIKEEITKGKAYTTAVNVAFRRSLPPILDGHITILLTAIILFRFGLGPVKGFATTQILGILLSLFSGILITRWITEIFMHRKVHLEYFTGLSKRIFQKAKFNFIGFRKKTFVISFIVLTLGISSFFNGFDYGVEFDGGRSYTVRFDHNMNSEIEPIRNELKATFKGESPQIKTVGNTSTLDITTSYLIKETGPQTDSVVETTLFAGLKKHLPANLTFQQFDENFKLGSNKVLPTISDDLKRGAIKATIVGILVIFLYIFIRFRDWKYSVGTIIALLHDVLVTLIVFSFARKIVPFPLQIDQHFIAAILTVIGFSMNEAVIIFDRIREDRKLYPTATLPETINRAINETLSRTIMTSLTVFLTILTIFILGGEVTRGFAFAMLVGVMTGVYSSMFVAAPMLLNLGGRKKVNESPVPVVKQAPKTATAK